MARPRKEVSEQVEEVVKPVVKAKVKAEPKDKLLLQEIAKLEADVKAKKKEYSEYIASQRKETKTPTVAECLKLAMRDDLNSERRELKIITGMALNKLKRTK